MDKGFVEIEKYHIVGAGKLMSNENGFNPTDHLIKINDVIIDMDKNEVWGCYRNEKEVLRKDMTDEELIHAHQVIRQRGFDLMAFKTKDC